MLTVKYLLKRCTNIKRFGLPSFKLDIPEFSIYIDFHYKPNVDNDYLQVRLNYIYNFLSILILI